MPELLPSNGRLIPTGRLYIERFVEPYTGMEMLGVGMTGDVPVSITVQFDGSLRAEDTATTSFAVQLPRERTSRHAQVRINAETVFEAEWDAIPWRGESILAPPDKPSRLGRVRGILQRGTRSILTGEALSWWRWRARLGRLHTKWVKLRQRLEHKILARRHPFGPPHDGYVRATALSPRLGRAMERAARGFQYRPRISIIVPIFNVDPRWIDEAIQSVKDQIYDNWELCLADDASTNPRLCKYLDRLSSDSRIKLIRRPKNGHICAASNSAADLATGEFVALLDHDDRLAPDALFEVVSLLQEHPDADLIYSDEDKIDEHGHRYDPQFKPDWSPELLLAYNYINHFTTIRKTIFEQAGRFRAGYEGSQDHDLLLRVIERTTRIHHIPRILYHWRSLPESTAKTAMVKPWVFTAGRRAIDDYLSRNGINAEPYQPEFARRLGLPILCFDRPGHLPSVATIDVEPGPRLAARLNAAARATDAEYLLFRRPNLEPEDTRWLSRLIGAAERESVGAVGPALTAGDGSMLGAGIVLGMRDGIAPANAFHGLPPDQISYYFYADVARNVSAVPIDCLLTQRRHFDRLGGFDEQRTPDTLFDVDYCLRLAEIGLRTVCCGEVRLKDPNIARANSGTERTDDPRELVTFRQARGRPRDRYHNPNLSEGRPFVPAADGPSRLPAVLGSPPALTLVMTHNLNKPEGAPRYLYEIVLGLKQRGRVEPELFSPVTGEGAAAYTEVGVPVMVRERPYGPRYVDGQWSPTEYDAAQRDLREILRERRPEVVIANTLVCFPLIEAAARERIPSVWIIHESYSPDHMARIFSPFGRARCEAAFSLASRVVPASHDTAARFAHLNGRGNVTVLHNGLIAKDFDADLRSLSRPEALSQIPRGEDPCCRIIAVGTVCERKGQHTLVEAAARLHSERDDFRCYLVGLREGIPYASYVRNLVRAHGLDQVVELVPETDNVRAFYRAADVFVCTSAMEAFSRSMLEAEAFGLPIVTTPCPGVNEQVFWGYNAWSFPFGDADTLATHLRRLIDDPTGRTRMGAMSRAAFDNHLSYDEMLDRYEAVILSVSRQGPRERMPLPPVPASDRATTRHAA